MSPTRSTAGFTLVEVMMAMGILAVVALSVGAATGALVRSAVVGRLVTQASASAEGRLAEVQVWPEYATIDSAFARVEADTPLKGWTRTTTVQRVGGPTDTTDVTRVTVTITAPGLATPLSRSLTISAAF